MSYSYFLRKPCNHKLYIYKLYMKNRSNLVSDTPSFKGFSNGNILYSFFLKLIKRGIFGTPNRKNDLVGPQFSYKSLEKQAQSLLLFISPFSIVFIFISFYFIFIFLKNFFFGMVSFLFLFIYFM